MPPSVNDLLQQLSLDYERALGEILETDRENGHLAKDADIELIIGCLMTLLSGLAMQAKGGESAAFLRDVAEVAIENMPGVSQRITTKRTEGRTKSPPAGCVLGGR